MTQPTQTQTPNIKLNRTSRRAFWEVLSASLTSPLAKAARVCRKGYGRYTFQHQTHEWNTEQRPHRSQACPKSSRGLTCLRNAYLIGVHQSHDSTHQAAEYGNQQGLYHVIFRKWYILLTQRWPIHILEHNTDYDFKKKALKQKGMSRMCLDVKWFRSRKAFSWCLTMV